MNTLKQLPILRRVFFALLFCFMLMSCADDLGSDVVELDFEGSELVGEWFGMKGDEETSGAFIRQYRVTFSAFERFKHSGDWRYNYYPTDICNPQIHTCDYEQNCSGTLEYTGKEGTYFTFRETVDSSGNCSEAGGQIKIDIINDNTIDYILLFNGSEFYRTLLKRQ